MALGEVVEPKRGKRLVKSQLQESGDYAVYQNSMTPLGYYEESNVQSETAFIICAGSAGEIGYSDVAFWAAGDVYYFLSNDSMNSKFLYHFLLQKKQSILSQVRRASIPRLSKSGFEKLQIPIPCPDDPEKSLAIQAEIARILDTFTELTTELTTRKQQYNYYRDQLLSFEGSEVEWKPLGEVGEFIRGKRFIKTDYVEEGIDAIHYGDIYTYYGVFADRAISQVRPDLEGSLRFARHGDVVIASVRNDSEIT